MGKERKKRGIFGRILRRTLLVLFATLLMLCSALVMVLNLIFNGPSEAARDKLTMSLIEASATKWVPKLFIGQAEVDRIKNGGGEEYEELSDDEVDTSLITIDNSTGITGNTDEWKTIPTASASSAWRVLPLRPTL